VSRRNDGKAARRSKIVGAARQMIVETGGDGFSMRALADRAAVSLVTPYSLFGSKAGVITALLDVEVQSMIAAVEAKCRLFEIEKLFQLIDETARAHAGNEVYLRYLLAENYDSPQADKYVTMRDRYIIDCVEEASRQGELSNRLPSPTIARALSAMYAGQMLAYGMSRSTLADMTRDCTIGFALVLEPVSSGSLKTYLQGYLGET